MFDRGWDFLRNAGTIIFAVSIVMWAALYYPRLSPDEVAPLVAEQRRCEPERDEAAAAGGRRAGRRAGDRPGRRLQRLGAQKRQSLLGRLGRLIEPAVRPLGWDWRIGSAVIASFPAREVVVATLGVIFDVGKDVEEPGGRPARRRPCGRRPGPGPAGRCSTSPWLYRSWSSSPSVPSASRPWR